MTLELDHEWFTSHHIFPSVSPLRPYLANNKEAYPPEYVEHNLPLVLISGLGRPQNDENFESPLPRQESGSRIQGSSPECSGERAEFLLKELLDLDGSNRPWNAVSLPPPSGNMRYRMKPIGRVGMRKSRPNAPQHLHYN